MAKEKGTTCAGVPCKAGGKIQHLFLTMKAHGSTPLAVCKDLVALHVSLGISCFVFLLDIQPLIQLGGDDLKTRREITHACKFSTEYSLL